MDKGGCLRSSSFIRSNVKPSIPFCLQNLSTKFDKFNEQSHRSTSSIVHETIDDLLNSLIEWKQQQIDIKLNYIESHVLYQNYY